MVPAGHATHALPDTLSLAAQRIAVTHAAKNVRHVHRLQGCQCSMTPEGLVPAPYPCMGRHQALPPSPSAPRKCLAPPAAHFLIKDSQGSGVARWQLTDDS